MSTNRIQNNWAVLPLREEDREEEKPGERKQKKRENIPRRDHQLNNS